MRSTSGSLGAGILLTIALAGTSLDAAALGFGRTTNSTHLGQPLDFSVLIRFDGGEFIASECVAAEVLSGEDRIPPNQLKVTIDAPNANGDRLLRVRSSVPMVEPVVNVKMNLGCPPQLTRDFVAFIDPPTLNLAEAPAPEPGNAVQAPAPALAASKPAGPPALRLARPSARAAARTAEAASDVTATPRRPRPARTAVRSSTRDVALAEPRDVAASAPAARPSDTRAKAAAAVANRGPRLQLEAPPARTAAAASAVAPLAVAQPASGAADAAAAQAAAAMAAAARASEVAAAAARASEAQARLQTLEASVARMRVENEATRTSLATLQSRLHDAESGRSGGNPLTNWLLALVALLLLALAGLVVWMRRRERLRDAWWNAAMQKGGIAPANASLIVDSHLPEDFDASAESVLGGPAKGMPAIDDVPTDAPGPVTWKPTHTIPELGTSAIAHRAVTADQLIDLEQQVEFFIALGQEDAAAGLLADHIAAAGGITPLPFLQLLDMHRRHGNREAFSRVREDFGRQFIATAPSWDDAGTVVRPLENFPDALSQLSEAWSTPQRAMGVLELMLFRSSGDEPVFDLAAARELLFLYEIARDLAGHADDHVMVVDFELPLGGAAPAERAVTQSLRPLQATRPATVDLDLDFDDLAVAEPAKAHAEDLSYGSAYGQAEPAGSAGKGR